MIFQDPANLLGYFIHRQIPIYRDQPASALIVIGYGLGLLLIRRKSWLNDFQPVVVAGHQFRPVRLIANFIQLGAAGSGRYRSVHRWDKNVVQ